MDLFFFREFALWFAAGIQPHDDFPKELAPPLFADRARMSSGTEFEIANQIFDRFFSGRPCLCCLIDVVDVSLVMLGVMNFHRARIDVRLKAS